MLRQVLEQLPAEQPANPLGRPPFTLLQRVVELLHELPLQPVDSSDTAVTRSLPPTPASLQRGLGQVGSAVVPREVWDYLRLPWTLPPHPLVQRRNDPSAQVLLRTLCEDNIVFPVPQGPAAPVFARFKSELKARVILDLRAYNALFPRPPPFHLPNLSSLLRTHQFHTHFFIKLDISNFFWSLTLPSDVAGAFTFAAGDTQTYGTHRLPFGWAWSPIIAQLTLARILSPVMPWFADRLWQYFDDLLVGDRDPYFLSFAGSYIVYLLARAGLVINEKSQLQPVTSLTWLGKHLHESMVSNTAPRIAQGMAHVWALRTRKLTFKALQKCLGTLQWLLSPASTFSPFLASSYALLRQPTLPCILP